MNAAELVMLANLLAALIRDCDVISEVIERHIAARRASHGPAMVAHRPDDTHRLAK